MKKNIKSWSENKVEKVDEVKEKVKEVFYLSVINV